MTETSLTSASSQRLRDLTRHVMVDFNQMKTFTSAPLIMVEGDGIRLTDDSGNRYIDGLSGVFAVSLGHGNEEIIAAIAAQHRRLSFSSPIMTTTDRALELAAELVRLTGERFDVVKQLSSGSEATEAALKMARQYHRQTRQRRAVQDDLVLPLLPRRDDGRAHRRRAGLSSGRRTSRSSPAASTRTRRCPARAVRVPAAAPSAASRRSAT